MQASNETYNTFSTYTCFLPNLHRTAAPNPASPLAPSKRFLVQASQLRLLEKLSQSADGNAGFTAFRRHVVRHLIHPSAMTPSWNHSKHFPIRHVISAHGNPRWT